MEIIRNGYNNINKWIFKLNNLLPHTFKLEVWDDDVKFNLNNMAIIYDSLGQGISTAYPLEKPIKKPVIAPPTIMGPAANLGEPPAGFEDAYKQAQEDVKNLPPPQVTSPTTTATTTTTGGNDFVGNFKDFQKNLGITPNTFDYAGEQAKANAAEAARLAAMRAAISAASGRERVTAGEIAKKRESGRRGLLGISEGLNATSYGQDYVEAVDTELKKELSTIDDLEKEALSKAEYTSADKLSQQLTDLRAQRDQVNQKIIDNFNTFQSFQKSNQPSDISDYNFYVSETQKTGGTPLSYFEWAAKKKLADTKPVEVGGALVDPNTGKVIYQTPEKKTAPITKTEKGILYEYDTATGTWKKATNVTYPTTTKPVNKEKAAIDEMNSQLQSVVGPDGFISPDSYTIARNAWEQKGFSPTTFDTKFKGFRNPNNPNYITTKKPKSTGRTI